MLPEEYDAWYRTPRGAWIGELEFRRLARLLSAEAGASLLDVGCGTGYFSRRFARAGHPVTAVDRDPAMIEFARAAAGPREIHCVADALALPFADAAFDYCISITALCFVADERRALREMVRVARRGVALGLLHRCSLLYWRKGRRGGTGAYRGARWHTRREVRELMQDARLERVRIETAVLLDSGSRIARAVEGLVPGGAFIAAAARKPAP